MTKRQTHTEKTGTLAGVPYDWRRPTKARFKARVWNPTAPFITKRWYGWGYDLNAYALVHPRKWRAARQASQTKRPN